MNANKIIDLFINYFKNKNHKHIEESSLIPKNDDTLMFTNSGMVQFKNVFLGTEPVIHKNIVTVQTCIRLGGKHNDLNTIGKSPHHNTSFKMLGNFSFRDYSKIEAISYAWDFLTNVLNIDKNKLYVTVHKNDEESMNIWKNIIKLEKNKIKIGNNKTNFWAMDTSGPCGYCSEIFYKIDNVNKKDKKKDKFLEIWNLVFMQFNKCSKKFIQLEKISIDTGIGLERIASIMQNVYDNYKTDLIFPLMEATKTVLNLKKNNTSIKIIVDHIKTCLLLINAGILPSNEGRGYIIKKLLRRIFINKKKLKTNVEIYKLIPTFIQELEKIENKTYDTKSSIDIFKYEENKFEETIKNGINYLNKITNNNELTGKDLFILYDTYGFPINFIKEITENRKINIKEFNKEMLAQKTKSKLNQKEKIEKSKIYNLEKTKFLGYDETSISSYIKIIQKNKKESDSIMTNEEGIIITENTCFYSEKGGQIYDTGTINNTPENIFKVNKVTENNNIYIHYGIVEKGSFKINDAVTLLINEANRREITHNHTSTHLLYAALKKILGPHIKQAGSLINEKHLRFDFTHFKPVEKIELEKIEDTINEQICLNLKVTTLIEKNKQKNNYNEDIRTVKIEKNISEEFCAGTHVKNTSEIMFFKIIKEHSIGSNIRRIEAITGSLAIKHIRKTYEILQEMSTILKTKEDDLIKNIKNIISDNKNKKKQIELYLINDLENTIKTAKQIINKDIKIIYTEIKPEYIKLMNNIINKYKNSIIILYYKLNNIIKFTINITIDVLKIISIEDIITHITNQSHCKCGGKSQTINGIISNNYDIEEIFKQIYLYINKL